jgi:hypothetical protein
MDLTARIAPHHFIHIGTDLILCRGTRHVRVLTLPSLCGNRRLLNGWTSCLGDEPDTEPDTLAEWPPRAKPASDHVP